VVFQENLTQFISAERFAPYGQDSDRNGSIDGYGRYFWNVALSESLYPGLQGLEVTLRNGIHEAAASRFGKEYWFDEVLVSQESQVFQEIVRRLNSQEKPTTVGQLIANSHFGFWVSLFNSRYEGILWPGLLKAVFPAMPNRLRTRRSLSARLNGIRKLRNRVFHYEPIWKYPNLAQLHGEIWETIGWISPDMLAAVKLFDRFPEVYQLGPTHYRERIAEYLTIPNP